MELSLQIDFLLNRLILSSEHSNEFLVGQCQSHVALTNTQEHILMLLLSQKLTNSDLAKELNVSQAAITKAVRSLINKELVEVSKDNNDGRVSYYTLTEAALPLAREHADHHTNTLEVYQGIVDKFTSDEQEIISKFLLELEKGVLSKS